MREQHEFAGDDLMSSMSDTITVWSDIGCPWATLALFTLSSAAERRNIPLLIDHRAFPLELFNRRSTPKPVLDAEVIAIAGLRPDLNWRQWDAPEWQYPATTLPAMAAVQAAKSVKVGGISASDQLDRALRRAFYVDHQCISVHSVILDVAAQCDRINTDALAYAMSRGTGLREVFNQWTVANRPEVQGSPQLFAAGFSAHNPGVTYHWTKPAEKGFPRFEKYDDRWADGVLDNIERPHEQ